MDRDSRQVVRRYYDEVFTAHSLAALDQVIAPDFVGHSASYGDDTIADMRRVSRRDFDAAAKDDVIVVAALAASDRVVAQWQDRWKHDLSLAGVTALIASVP